MRLILASASPRRQALLRQIGVDFFVDIPHIDEQILQGEGAQDLVSRLSVSKAQAVFARHPDDLVLAADTVGVLNDIILNKPKNKDEAEAMLCLMSGQTHEVLTAYCLKNKQEERRKVVKTRVKFRSLTDKEIAQYLHTGEWQDKAGAYAIQGMGAALVAKIDGDYANVVGLPLSTLVSDLAYFSIPFMQSALGAIHV